MKVTQKTTPAAEEPEIETANGIQSSWFGVHDLEFSLHVDHALHDGPFLEEIVLTRDEYVAAKAFVAGLRGIKAEPEAKAA